MQDFEPEIETAADDPVVEAPQVIPLSDGATALRGAAMRAAISGVVALTNDIRAGRVTIEPGAGARLVSALRGQSDDANGWLERAQALACSIPLGRNDIGVAMAGKFRRRAESDDTSFVVVLRRYVEVLAAATTAVTSAMADYQDTDHERAWSLRTVDA
ncbi:hypothetical protein [Actinokineospora sp. NBRC 105648]|uniref:hypothetical protein n=1 Tax=Actinokineospora sp. NBRC 105648 TaxID=3032206 RepID=UPI0024A5B1B0|nr:hypothetical protein [Actinokineospora sp. NBRC 105648]GLZ38691.1 hypothetical protein Acsp05_23150 [Actinokineospora sp. NBRC 105648]